MVACDDDDVVLCELGAVDVLGFVSCATANGAAANASARTKLICFIGKPLLGPGPSWFWVNLYKYPDAPVSE
jgi:hypothetical protein